MKRRSGDRFNDLVKRTYCVRGLTGCCVYFEDSATAHHIGPKVGTSRS